MQMDGKNDCGNNCDEDPLKCAQDSFTCYSNINGTEKIPISMRCDGVEQCSNHPFGSNDGFDERCCPDTTESGGLYQNVPLNEFCTASQCERLGRFPCSGPGAKQVCLDFDKLADGIDDCGNLCDENWSLCDREIFPKCTSNCFTCKNGIQVSMSWNFHTLVPQGLSPYGSGICNGVDNCGDGSDEVCCGTARMTPGLMGLGAAPQTLTYDSYALRPLENKPRYDPTCTPEDCAEFGGFYCSGWQGNHMCITQSMVKDGVDHCGNSCDETPESFKCNSDQYFVCDNRRGIAPLRYVCDQQQHCDDFSDEILECCNKPVSTSYKVFGIFNSDESSSVDVLGTRCTYEECALRGRFKCKGKGSNHKCLHRDLVNDGNNDCGNNCDEDDSACDLVEAKESSEEGVKRPTSTTITSSGFGSGDVHIEMIRTVTQVEEMPPALRFEDGRNSMYVINVDSVPLASPMTEQRDETEPVLATAKIVTVEADDITTASENSDSSDESEDGGQATRGYNDIYIDDISIEDHYKDYGLGAIPEADRD